MSVNIAAIYLLRNQTNIDKDFFNFYSNYSNFNPGIKHQLVILLKGWSRQDLLLQKIKKLLLNFNPTYLEVPNNNFDIGSYIYAESLLKNNYKYLFFLNTYSFPQQKKWLKKFYENLLLNSVNITAASGSFDDWKFSYPRFNNFNDIILFPIRFIIRLKNHIIFIKSHNKDKIFHFRTNGFMIKRSLFKNFFSKIRFPLNKIDTYKIELGKKSISNYVLKNDKKIIIIGRNNIYSNFDLVNKSIFNVNLSSEIIISDNYTRLVFRHHD